MSRWRSQFRTDKLYSDINYVLERFCEPYYGLFAHVDNLISSGQTSSSNASLPLLAQSLLLLTQLFYDLCSQDLPPFFEDRMGDFMGDAASGKEGWLKKYLNWDPAELRGDVSRAISMTATSSLHRMMTTRLDRCRGSGRQYVRLPNCSPRSIWMPSPN